MQTKLILICNVLARKFATTEQLFYLGDDIRQFSFKDIIKISLCTK